PAGSAKRWSGALIPVNWSRTDHLSASDTAHMRVMKAAARLQTVAERPIKPDMGNPDHPQLKCYGVARKAAQADQAQRPDKGMKHVIGKSANAGTGKVAQHGKIRRQKQYQEENPGPAGESIKGDGGEEYGQPFQPDDDIQRTHEVLIRSA